jgi:hypothetical protein
MSNPTDPVADNGQQWWISCQGKPAGPHSEAFLMSGLRTGAISPQTYACAVGTQQWRRLYEWPAFASFCAMPPPPPPENSATPAVSSPTPTQSRIPQGQGGIIRSIPGGIGTLLGAIVSVAILISSVKGLRRVPASAWSDWRFCLLLGVVGIGVAIWIAKIVRDEWKK